MERKFIGSQIEEKSAEEIKDMKFDSRRIYQIEFVRAREVLVKKSDGTMEPIGTESLYLVEFHSRINDVA